MKIRTWYAGCLVILALTSCVTVPKDKVKDPDASPASPALVFTAPQLAAPFYIGVALLDSSGRALNKISGHVFCGEGSSQRPANRARMELWDKTKILTTVTTDMDGSYVFNYKPGFKEDFKFKISAGCGKISETLRKEIVKNYDTVDFWIK